jgi:hypothetical protein
MAEGIITVDDDWKRQAQQEKQRLADESATKAAKPPSPAGQSPAAESRQRSPGRDPTKDPRSAPEASFTGLVQSLMTQSMFYLGELAQRGQEPSVDLDMAKYQLDLLFVLEQKTTGNLTPEEKKLIDQVLYEVRMRFVSVASQYLQ